MRKFKNYTKICDNCGREFKAHNKRRRYCCESCKVIAYQNRISKGIHLKEMARKVKAYLAQKEEEKRIQEELRKQEEERRANRSVTNAVLEDYVYPTIFNSDLSDNQKIGLSAIAGIAGTIIDEQKKSYTRKTKRNK